MSGAVEDADGPDGADTVEVPAAVVRRVRVLLGMVPLAEMSADEVAAVFRDRMQSAG